MEFRYYLRWPNETVAEQEILTCLTCTKFFMEFYSSAVVFMMMMMMYVFNCLCRKQLTWGKKWHCWTMSNLVQKEQHGVSSLCFPCANFGYTRARLLHDKVIEIK